MRVLGVDGVRGRWLGALLTLDPDGVAPAAVTWTLGSAADVLEGVRDPQVRAAGIDVPVGLVAVGPRGGEAEARTLLRASAGSIFATAPQPAFAVARAAGGATRANRVQAEQAARAAGGGGISTQAWNIADKVLEVEDAVRALGPAGERVHEVHPESSFARMADDLRAPRPASKRSAAGVAGRIGLLGRAVPSLDVLAALAAVPLGAGAADRVPVDDALDALAACLSALRQVFGAATVLGGGQPAVWSDGSPAPGRGRIVV